MHTVRGFLSCVTMKWTRQSTMINTCRQQSCREMQRHRYTRQKRKQS